MNAPAAITIATATALAIAWAVPLRASPSPPASIRTTPSSTSSARSSPATRIASWPPSKRRRARPWSCSTRAAAMSTRARPSARSSRTTISQPASPLAANARPPAFSHGRPAHGNLSLHGHGRPARAGRRPHAASPSYEIAQQAWNFGGEVGLSERNPRPDDRIGPGHRAAPIQISN